MSQSTPPKSIDDYIAGFPPEVQALLEQVRTTIRQAEPEAVEGISYAIPAFFLAGQYLIYFAGYKRHIGLYPAPSGVPEFEAALARYQAGKGTLRFPLREPLPLDLITRIV